jgi:hypothetical protein
MKRKTINSVVIILLMTVFSCDEPETIVTNNVHTDGSVTRRIEMRNKKNNFKPSDLQVPFDSTWIIKDTIAVGEKGDTTWIKTAEKLFKNVDEINKDYITDKGANKEIKRKAEFIKKFRWFNTQYRFSEIIDRKMSFGYPVKDFLNQEELKYFYSPESVRLEKIAGPDSIKFKAFFDTIRKKTDKWTARNLASEWIGEFSRLTKARAGNEMTMESLKAREDDFVKIIEANDKMFDSLWTKGIILKEFIGENNATKFKIEADTALAITMRQLFVNFKNYSVRIVMPGNVIGANGFIDKQEGLLWPVISDYFITEPYIMWAESKISNTWAWIVSGVFLLFVVAGLILRIVRK